VTLFNLKGETVWELGEDHRNEIHFNPQSSIMATCAFGNLSSGKIQFWDIEKMIEISCLEAPHTTHFEWAPDGQHFSTSTTAPRLRTDNAYRIWNYKGELLYERKYEKEELWQVMITNM
jgi:translation initiation factor 2A